MKRSLRLNLLVGTTVASTLILGCLGVGLYLAMRATLLQTFDATLRAKARTLAAMVEQHDKELIFEFDKEALPEFVRGKHPSYFEMWSGGKVWQRSARLGDDDLVAGKLDRAEWTRLKSGHTGRMVSIMFTPRAEDEGDKPQPQLTMAVADDTEEVEEQLFTDMWILAIACAAAVVISGVTLVAVVNRALAPLGAVAGQIERLQEADLSLRVGAEGIPAELVVVVERLNGLLGRLERAFERERGFTADAAHELRTPLAGMKATLEVCRSRSREEAEYAAAIDKSLAIAGAMQRIVENLLMLARAEGGQLAMKTVAVCLDGEMREVWEAFAERARVRRLRLEWAGEAGCFGEADPEALRMVLANIFENAVSYADEGGTVTAGARIEGMTAEMRVANTGCTLTGAEAGRVFERFWRHDTARSQTGVHAGLGLSLCERLVGVMGGRVRATSEGGVFVVTVKLKAGRVDFLVV